MLARRLFHNMLTVILSVDDIDTTIFELAPGSIAMNLFYMKGHDYPDRLKGQIAQEAENG